MLSRLHAGKARTHRDLLARFAEDVLAGRWRGNKAVWIAPEDAGGELVRFPAGYDHLRAIPVPGETP